jgi:hypothetical protein
MANLAVGSGMACFQNVEKSVRLRVYGWGYRVLLVRFGIIPVVASLPVADVFEDVDAMVPRAVHI